ncbi:hypothetical protein ONZ45_g9122 [Pleurotus djamor]|nr:hypothetical protein ONZ45_g9122 [Pleurotus djamor]
MASSIDPSKLESTLSSIQLVKYMSLATMVIIFYDYCLTFNLEIVLIWPQKWSFMKLLFIASRYLPFFDLLISFIPQVLIFPGDVFCVATFDLAAASFAIGYFLTELAMAIWVWSLWNRDKKVGIAILSLFVAAWMAIPIFQNRFVTSAKVTRSTFAPLSGCFLTLDSKKAIGTFCILLAFNLVTFIATLMRVISIQADNTHIGGLSRIAYANCLFYYICLLVSSAVNLVVAVALPVSSSVHFGFYPFLTHFIRSLRTPAGTCKRVDSHAESDVRHHIHKDDAEFA